MIVIKHIFFLRLWVSQIRGFFFSFLKETESLTPRSGGAYVCRRIARQNSEHISTADNPTCMNLTRSIFCG
jgi:hypothetical protein